MILEAQEKNFGPLASRGVGFRGSSFHYSEHPRCFWAGGPQGLHNLRQKYARTSSAAITMSRVIRKSKQFGLLDGWPLHIELGDMLLGELWNRGKCIGWDAIGWGENFHLGEMLLRWVENRWVVVCTPHQKVKWIIFQFPIKIPVAYEFLVQMLQENKKLKKSVEGARNYSYFWSKNWAKIIFLVILDNFHVIGIKCNDDFKF